MSKLGVILARGGVLWLLSAVPFAANAYAQSAGWKVGWEKALEGAKKEGKLVASVPPSPQVRKGMEEGFAKKYGISVEFVTGRGATVIRRIADEAKAGVRYFDLHVGGTKSIVEGLLPERILDPVEPWMVLPEVKDPSQWWGGHIWVDNAKRYIYAFSAYQTTNAYYNSDLMNPEEFKSFDDLLNPKWKGKIGFSDPRVPGSGDSMWSYLVQVKGEEFVKKLVDQEMFITRDLRLLAENLAKGRIAIAIGIGYSELLPFIKAGLPVKPLPTPVEGFYATSGYGALAVLKEPPHPNATKLFVNWLLGKEGQDIFGRYMGAPTRRFDVDTSWTKEFHVLAAKDGLTLEQYRKTENQSEEKVYKVRNPASALARKLLK